VQTFLGDEHAAPLHAGRDDRWTFHPRVPLWATLAFFVPFARW
jgi:hypothetical protein